MKYLITLLLMCGVAFCDELETPQISAILINTTDANMTALDANDACWDTAKDWVKIPQRFNALKVEFYAYGDGDGAGDPNDGWFAYQLYVCDYGGTAQLVADSNAVVGNLELAYNPVSVSEIDSGGDPNDNYCWVDTLNAITTEWKDGITRQNYSGTDGLSSFIFDRQCGMTVYCRIYSITNLTNVWCIAYGY